MLWRRWRRFPEPSSEVWPSRVEAVEMAFALHAAGHERMLADVIEQLGKRKDSGRG